METKFNLIQSDNSLLLFMYLILLRRNNISFVIEVTFQWRKYLFIEIRFSLKLSIVNDQFKQSVKSVLINSAHFLEAYLLG